MKYQEKKYKVDSFSKIKKILEEKGVRANREVLSTHYYSQQESNDVVKLVKFSDKNEIHKLEESNGRFNLKENIPMESAEEGFEWLKNKGYKTVNVAKMANTDFEYKGGIVGLYLIDDFLHSVILDFPEGQAGAIEREFGLSNAEVINIPYNKYLEKIGKLKTVHLS